MNSLTVRAKLTWAFGLLALVVLLVSGFALKSLSDAHQRFDSFVNGITERVDMAAHVRSAVARRAIAARNLLLVTSPEEMAIEKEKVLVAHGETTESMAKLKQMGQANDVLEEGRRLIAEMDRVEKAYAPVALDIVDKALSNRRAEAIEKMNKECRPLLASLDKAAQSYTDFVRTVSAKRVEAAAEGYAAQRNLLIGACAFALLLAGGAGALLSRSLTRALGGEPAELGTAMQRVADGDLSVRIQTASGDDSSVMATAARMQAALSQLVSSVRQNSESVATASAQIAQGNQDLSSRTEQQASALQQTASTMDQLGTTVRNNADSAKLANQLAQGASAVAAQGGEVVGKVVTTMQGINVERVERGRRGRGRTVVATAAARGQRKKDGEQQERGGGGGKLHARGRFFEEWRVRPDGRAGR